MRTRLRHWLEVLSSSYWFVPTVMLLLAAALAMLLIRLEQALVDRSFRTDWFYGGGPEGARGLLAVIGGTVITVAGVVFSITVSTLTQASSQFGPRLLRNFMRDRGNQIVLGVFVATFIYCLLVLRTIRSESSGEFVPHIAVTVAIVLAVASLAVLIYFIHHAASSLQAPHIIENVHRDLMNSIDELYPEDLGQPPKDIDESRQVIAAKLQQSHFAVRSTRSGYVQAIDSESLMDLLRKHDLVAELVVRPGKIISAGSVIACVHPRERCNPEVESKTDDAFLLGSQRTSEQDAEFAVDQLVEIAVRALSPGVNDPFTAINVLDMLGPALATLAGRQFPPTVRADEDGTPRLIVDASDFNGLCEAAFNMIRQNGRRSVAVSVRLLETIESILLACPKMPEDRRRCLLCHAELCFAQAIEEKLPEPDANDLRERIERVRRAAGHDVTIEPAF